LEKIILVTLAALELNLDEFKKGRLHEKHAVATWNLGTILAFAWRQKNPETCVVTTGRRTFGIRTDI
jgi:hypothetical protein